MSFDPGQSNNPYQAPQGAMSPPPSSGPDVPMILGIISISFGVVAVPLSCCACIGVFPGGLAVILGIVALVMPARPGSPAKMLGIGGIVLGLVPLLWFIISLGMAAMNPNMGNPNNNPFPNIEIPAEADPGQK